MPFSTVLSEPVIWDNGLRLFFSARASLGVVWISLLTGSIYLWLSNTVFMPGMSPVVVPAPALLPFLPAAAIGLATGTRMSDWEKHASRSLIGPMLQHMLFLYLVAGLVLTSTLLASAEETSLLYVSARNLLGFGGLSAISAAFCGSSLAWLLPAGLITVSIGLLSTGQDILDWIWFLQPADEVAGTVIAGLCLIFGLVATVLGASLQSRRDADV